MLLTRDTLINRLEHHLKTATQIDVAVAWASECDALRRLLEFVNNGGSLRAIIGITGNATTPSALRSIQKCAQLRIPTGAKRLFHPKLYLFHAKTERISWVGSANLTRPGFQQNDELVFEFADDDNQAMRWFDTKWSMLGNDEDCDRTLKKYEQTWQPPSALPRTPEPYERPVKTGEIYEVAGGLTDWDSFVRAVTEADRYWSVIWESERPVTGDGTSWLETITRGHAVALRKDWDKLSEDDRRLLLGRHPWGLLGSMGPAGRANKVFVQASQSNLRIRRIIRDALQPTIDADSIAFAKAACDFIEAVCEIDGFGGAIATRLLALARPDRAISVNNGSRVRLAQLTGLPKNSLNNVPRRRRRSYLDLLQWFEGQGWYSSPSPRNAYERVLADARGALIDTLVYEKQ